MSQSESYFYAHFDGLLDGADNLHGTSSALLGKLQDLVQTTGLEWWCSANDAKTLFDELRKFVTDHMHGVSQAVLANAKGALAARDIGLDVERYSSQIWS